MNDISTDFDLNCRACPRLAGFLDDVVAEYHLERALCLVSSYHCSRYNTSTNRLMSDMFENVFKQINGLLER